MTNAEARFSKSLRPRKPEGSLGRTAQDVHLDSHTAPELSTTGGVALLINKSYLFSEVHLNTPLPAGGGCEGDVEQGCHLL